MSGELASMKRCDKWGGKGQDDVTQEQDIISAPKCIWETKMKHKLHEVLLVLFGFLLNIADFLRNLLQCVLVSTVLHLEVCWESQYTDSGSSGLLRVSLALLPLGRCCL